MTSQKSLFERRVLARLETLRANLTDETEVDQPPALGRTAFQREVLDGLDDIASAAGSFVDITYLFQAVDFGGGDSTEVIAGPAGKRGRVKAVSVFNVTEAFNAVTTPARVDIGDGTDADEFGLSGSLGTTGVGEAISPEITDGDDVVVPADQDVTLTFVAPTGGGPNTGIADVAVTIRWFD